MPIRIEGNTQKQRIFSYVSNRATPATISQITKATGIATSTAYARLSELVTAGTIYSQNARNSRKNRVYSA